jgi:hypothetical protein
VEKLKLISSHRETFPIGLTLASAHAKGDVFGHPLEIWLCQYLYNVPNPDLEKVHVARCPDLEGFF